MAGRTQYYGLGYFDYRDRVDSAGGVRLEQERFLTIDRQIFGMYSLFGNGVVSGLSVAGIAGSSVGSSISVSPGVAFIQGRAVYIENPVQLSGIPAGDSIFIYMRVLPGFGPGIGSVFYSMVPSLPNCVRLARIKSGINLVEQVDSSVQQQVSFRSLILNEIAKHKHRGTPSRIDLLREVKNFLPGARIGDIDAEQIDSGQLSVERIPRLRHSQLKDSGTLSHAGLESLARSLQTSDRVLMGEVTAVNQLQQNIAFRRSHPDHPDYSINTITYVPGTSSDQIVDFSKTTAVYSPSAGCIAGRQQTAGTFINLKYDSATELRASYASNNIIVIDGDAGGLTLTSTVNQQTVLFADSFETGTDSGVPGFSFAVTSVSSSVGVAGDATVQVEGTRSAKLTSGIRNKVVFRKALVGTGNWEGFNKLFFYVRCVAESHPAVTAYLINESAAGEEVKTDPIVVLTANEQTSNPDPALDNFKLIEYNLVPFDRNNVKALVFEVADASAEFSFNIDDARTSTVSSSEVLYQPNGFSRYRYSANSPFILNAISWISRSIPTGTSIEIRYRHGNTLEEISSALFIGPIASNSGQSINVSAQIVDVEVALRSSADRRLAPILKEFEIQLRVNGDVSGFSISTRDGWEACTLSNASVFDLISPAAGVRIRGPLEIGLIYYGSNDTVQLIDENNVSVFGTLGADLPIAPTQASRPNYVWQAENIPGIGFDQPSAVARLPNKSFLIADTYNNRVLEIGRDGKFVRGVGNAEPLPTGSQFVPLCACLNPKTRLLQIVMSQSVSVPDDFDKSKVELVIGSDAIKLNELDALVSTGRPPNVVQIRISQDKVVLVQQGASSGLQPFCRINATAFGEDRRYSDSALLASNYGLNGLRLFFGDFTYLNSVYHPVSVEYVDDHWLICNSTIRFDRIRAGLRPDTDEYFLNKSNSTGLQFVVAYRFPNDESLDENGNPYIVKFMEAQGSGGTIVLQGSPSFSGTATISQIDGQYIATLDIKPGSADNNIGVTYLVSLNIRIYSLVVPPDGGNAVEIEVPFSPQVYQFRVTVVDEDDDAEAPAAPAVPTLVKLRTSDWAGVFSFGTTNTFAVSDFTLGSACRYGDDQILLAGLEFSSGTPPTINPSEVNAFVGQALTRLAPYRGRVIVLNSDGTRSFQYSSPDGLYPSDASLKADGRIIVSESAVGSASGRVINIDSFGQVLTEFSNGSFGLVNDARESGSGLTLIST